MKWSPEPKLQGRPCFFSRFSFWQIQTERILKNKTVETHSYELKDFRLQTGLRPGPWAKSVRRSLDPNQVLKSLHLQCKARCPRCTDACAQAAHTHTHRLHTRRTRWRTLQQVQQIHQIQKFQGILPRNLRRFQKCTAEQAGPQFKEISKESKNSQRQIQTERILRNKTP